MDAAEKKKSRSSSRASIQSLGYDNLSMVFVYLDHLDLARCSSVCISWYDCIHTSDLLKVKYNKQRKDSHAFSNAPSSPEASLKTCLKELAMEEHRVSLQNGPANIYQWNAHSAGVDQCRMKMGSVLTGVGDKVVRIWSLESYKCLEEYSIPDKIPLVDFDFDESKIVGLLKTRICIWRRHGERISFPFDTVTSGLCMRYIDPEAVVGCGDGTVRIFDMYSKKCTQIIRTHTAPVTCLAFTDNQLMISGSSAGSIKMADLSSDQRVASLRSTDFAGIRSLCFNPNTSLVFSGTTAGHMHCYDIRTMKPLWGKKVCTNVIYSTQHMKNETSSLVVGGIDGVLRVLDQNTGDLISSYVIGDVIVGDKRRATKLSQDDCLDSVPKYRRPPITCLAVGMKKVVTTHNSKVVRVWRFK